MVAPVPVPKKGNTKIIIAIVFFLCLSSVIGGLLLFFWNDLFPPSPAPSPIISGGGKSPGPKAPSPSVPGPKAPSPSVPSAPLASGPSPAVPSAPLASGPSQSPVGMLDCSSTSTQASQITGYTRMPGKDKDGATIGRGFTIPANSVSTCTNACNNTPGCVGVSIFNEFGCSSGTYLGDVRPECYLLRDTSNLQDDENYTIYKIQTPTVPGAPLASGPSQHLD